MPADVLVFPNTRAAITDLINGTIHLGEKVTAVWWLPTNDYGQLEGPYPLAVVTALPGTQGDYDRVDRITLEVYAPGEDAVNTLESITGVIVGDGIETEDGTYLDEVGVLSTPVDTPSQYASDTLNHAVATYEVTVRPL
ncbi:hypothetical protein [Tersicoccus sp. Bi-70]|uniref:hypothetical protein n=1 Tax=Tersicoccus sp. Bi-70 TaxID=1897634 RepID=UPI000976A787|nr:hypothetical protein [Tersicoccus sp. Bi-70]OMH30652.1 hypothetical protein BGP79_11885 [Tersicoccus sp. Bi-70]